MTSSEVDFTDVQGLVCFGYGKMTRASYALVRIKDVAAAQSWLRGAPVSNGVKVEAKELQPTTALNIAFTRVGLEKLGVPDTLLSNFSKEFRAGMTQEARARQLGDVGRNAPECWEWGGPANEPHLLVMFFAVPGSLKAFVQGLTGVEWSEAFDEPIWLQTENLDGFEPFGFADGVSQPEIDWDQRRDPTKAQLDYTNRVALGEFLLGYPNEYGKYTERPLLPADGASVDLLAAQDKPTMKDLGRNGTYLVMRQLEQDVRGFWKFTYQQAGENEEEATKLAEAMVGRTIKGDPLVPLQKKRIRGTKKKEIAQNQFTFESDPAGARCPFGAHVRRANPRNTDFPGRPASIIRKVLTMLGFGPKGFRFDLMSSVRFHRILRRGREYGCELKPKDALVPPPPDDPKRGLHFICLNANISRQFEFLQNAWIASTKFSGLTGESDPLLGNREPIPGCPVTANFTMQKEAGLRTRVTGLPQFVRVRGGAYFFLPSLRAIRYFAREQRDPGKASPEPAAAL